MDDFDTTRREAESALRALSLACSRVKQGDRRACDEGALALTRARKALQQMQGKGDAWVFGKLTAETSRLAAELERGTLLLGGRQGNSASTPTALSSVEQDTRTRIIRNNQVLQESNMYARDATRQLIEARDGGINTLQALEEQRNDLMTARTDVRDTESVMQSSRIILMRMAKQALVNKLFLWGVVVLLLIANILFLYYGYIKN